MTYLIPSDAYPVICPECAGSQQDTRTEVVPVEGYDNRVLLKTTFQRCGHTASQEMSVDTTDGAVGDTLPEGITVDWSSDGDLPADANAVVVTSRIEGCGGTSGQA